MTDEDTLTDAERAEKKEAERKLREKILVDHGLVDDKGNADIAKWSALMNSIYPGASSKMVLNVWDYCKARNLDPMKRVVHIITMNKKVDDEWIKVEVIVPGIAEYRTTAFRTKSYMGMEAPVLGDDMLAPGGANVPQSVTVTVYRLVSNVKCAWTFTAYYSESVGLKNNKPNKMWDKRPIGQLTKCAEAGALRMAFPEELGGEYFAEELAGQEIYHEGATIEATTGKPVGGSKASRLMHLTEPSEEVDLNAAPVTQEPETAPVGEQTEETKAAVADFFDDEQPPPPGDENAQ